MCLRDVAMRHLASPRSDCRRMVAPLQKVKVVHKHKGKFKRHQSDTNVSVPVRGRFCCMCGDTSTRCLQGRDWHLLQC